MSLLYELIYQHPIAAAVQALFTLAMVVDAFRRGADQRWFWVIIVLPLIGPIAYFIVEVVPRWRGGDFSGWFQRPVALQELRYRVEQAPTLANHLALAQRLMDKGGFAEATPHLEAAHKREPEHCQVLYSLALCYLRQGRADDAMALLSRLIARDQRWSDFSAWRLLREAQVELGRNEDALTTCREMVRLSPSLQNQCVLAEQLIDMDHAEEARVILEKALNDHSYQPGPIRRRNRRWAAEAKRLLRSSRQKA